MNHVPLLLFPSTEMYHLLPFLLLLTSATGDGNFRFTSTHVIVNETPFTQASFGISRTGGQAQPVTLTCQVSTGYQIYYRAQLFERLLNSSPIDELGHWCLQSCWSRAMLYLEGEVSMATLRAAPTRHHHTEQFSGILTDQYLPSP